MSTSHLVNTVFRETRITKTKKTCCLTNTRQSCKFSCYWKEKGPLKRTLSTKNRLRKNMPLLDQTAEDEWTTSPFECLSDVRGCLDSVCCFSCQFGRQCAALAGSSDTLDQRACLLAFFVPCGAPCFVMNLRSSIRSRFGISGSMGNDLLMSWCCLGCSHCQHQRELSNRGYWPGGSCFASAPPGGIG